MIVIQLILNTAEYCQCHQRQGKIFREQYFRRKKFLLLYGCQTIFVVVWALWIQHTLLQTDGKKLVLDILQWFQISIITWKKFLFMTEIIQWYRLRIIIRVLSANFFLHEWAITLHMFAKNTYIKCGYFKERTYEYWYYGLNLI